MGGRRRTLCHTDSFISSPLDLCCLQEPVQVDEEPKSLSAARAWVATAARELPSFAGVDSSPQRFAELALQVYLEQPTGSQGFLHYRGPKKQEMENFLSTLFAQAGLSAPSSMVATLAEQIDLQGAGYLDVTKCLLLSDGLMRLASASSRSSQQEGPHNTGCEASRQRSVNLPLPSPQMRASANGRTLAVLEPGAPRSENYKEPCSQQGHLAGGRAQQHVPSMSGLTGIGTPQEPGGPVTSMGLRQGREIQEAATNSQNNTSSRLFSPLFPLPLSHEVAAQAFTACDQSGHGYLTWSEATSASRSFQSLFRRGHV